jgi:hypothetical protein
MEAIRVPFKSRIMFVKFVENLPWMCLCVIEDEALEVHTVESEGRTSLLKTFDGDLVALSSNGDAAVRKREKISIYRLVGFEYEFAKDIVVPPLRYCEICNSEALFFENDVLVTREIRDFKDYLQVCIDTEDGNKDIKMIGTEINPFDGSTSMREDMIFLFDGSVVEIPLEPNESFTDLVFVSEDEVCYKVSDKWKRFNYKKNSLETVGVPRKSLDKLSHYTLTEKICFEERDIDFPVHNSKLWIDDKDRVVYT